MLTTEIKHNKLNPKLIQKFIDITHHRDIIFNKFSNYNGENKWVIIMSAIDWISVSVDAIDAEMLLKENSHEASQRCILFISCVSILWESVRQLHKVFIDERTVPFEKSYTIFTKNNSKEDNKFFSVIRSCFAAHPVDIHNFYGKNKEKEHFYASWSGNFDSKEGDLCVYLRSSKVKRPDIKLIIYFDELFNFAKERYEYLNVIIDKIHKEYFSDVTIDYICDL